MPSELEKLIEKLKETVAVEERRGQTNTVHHSMLADNLKLLNKPSVLQDVVPAPKIKEAQNAKSQL